MSSGILLSVILAVIALVLGLLIGNWLQKRSHERTLDQAHDSAAGIIESAKKEAETLKKEKIVSAREKAHQYQTQVEAELKDRRS